MDTLLNLLLLIAILGGSALVTGWFTKKMYNRCTNCATLNAHRRSHCRVCGAAL